MECSCVEDDEERTIKAQIEVDGEAKYSTLASKHKRFNFSCGKLQIVKYYCA